jgi:ribose-phosphate pyrophosphokinase
MSRFNKTSSRSTLRILGGSSHPELTALIAKKVGVKPGKVILGKFSNNETRVQLDEQVRNQAVFIIQTGAVHSNDAIIELLFLINACKLASSHTITVVTPFFPYSKGDQKSSLRSPISSKLVANMLKRAGADHLMMLDPHSPQLEGFFDCPVDCLKVEPLFCTWIKNHIPNWQQCMVVSPDEGGAKRSVMIANSLGLEFAMIHNRHKKTMKTNSNMTTPGTSRAASVPPALDDSSDDLVHLGGPGDQEPPEELRLTHKMVDKLLKISGDVSGFDCIVVDDMVDTGSTIRLALEVLQHHKAGKVYVLVTHGIFSGFCSLILQEAPNLEKIVVTNSLPQKNNIERMGDKLDVIDISGLVSEFIRRSHYNESVSVLSYNYFKVGKDGERNIDRKISEDSQDNEVCEIEGPPVAPRGPRKGFRLESICWD